MGATGNVLTAPILQSVRGMRAQPLFPILVLGMSVALHLEGWGLCCGSLRDCLTQVLMHVRCRCGCLHLAVCDAVCPDGVVAVPEDSGLTSFGSCAAKARGTLLVTPQPGILQWQRSFGRVRWCGPQLLSVGPCQ